MVAQLTSSLIISLLVVASAANNIFVIDSHPAASEDKLISVVVLYRHGDRSPISSFPTDEYYNSTYWPEGYGQLLKKGVLRQYQLGQWLRARYDTFLPAEYSSYDITVYSTDVDRTLMSAEANLAGLYPPVESHVWEEGFYWEPIPVHLMGTDDPIFAMNSECPKFDALQEELKTSEFFKNISIDNSNFFEKLSEYTGMNVSDVSAVANIYGVLYAYQNHNESYLPSWAADIDQDKLRYLAGLEFAKSTFTNQLKRLRAGPFFNYLINYFNDIVNGSSDNTKFLMFSGHDGTIATILGGMGAFDNVPPQFASMLIWELRKNEKGGYYINTMYKPNSTESVDQVYVESCGSNCTFEDFKSNLDPINIDSATWAKECIVSSSIQIVVSWTLLFVLLVLQRLP